MAGLLRERFIATVVLSFLVWFPALGLPTAEFFTNASAAGGTSYLSGTTLNGQRNPSGERWLEWNTATTTSGPFVQLLRETNTYAGFPTGFPYPAGGVTNVAWVPNGSANGNSACLQLSRVIGPDPNQTLTNRVFASFLMDIPNTNGLPTSGSPIYFMGFCDTNYTNYASGATLPGPPPGALKFFVGATKTAGLYSTWVSSGNASGAGFPFYYTPPGASPNAVLFIVMDYEFAPAANHVGDMVKLWVNPAPGTFGALTAPMPNTSSTNTNNWGAAVLTNAAGFLITARSGAMPDNGIYISDLFIGTTWSYVTGGPEFITQPVTARSGGPSNVILTATAAAAGQTVLWAWEKNGILLTNGPTGTGSTLAGAGTGTLTISNATQNDDGQYSVMITASGTAYSAGSSNAIVTVDPVITNEPANIVVGSGQTASFSVGAFSSGTLGYQWFRDGTALTGTTNPLLILTNVSGSLSNTTYTCVVSNLTAGTFATTTPAVLTVLNEGIVAEPAGTNVNYGNSAALSVESVGGPFTYQWYQNGNAISGGTGSNLNIAAASYLNDGNYTVVLADSSQPPNLFTSAPPAVLTVNDPYISVQPSNQTATSGATVTFQVMAAGTPPLGYVWSKAGQNLSDGGNISGSASAALTISPATDTNAGTYAVTVSGASGAQVASAPATLTVLPSVVVEPAARVEHVGDHLGFVAVSTGGALLSYQWQFNGTNIPGQTGSALSLTNIQPWTAGVYTVTVTNSLGLPAYNSGTLAVTAGELPLAPSNLVVARIGDGLQTLNTTTGNTLYLDQFSTNGDYVNTIMIPDSGPTALIEQGSGAGIALVGSVLTLSANGQNLNFTGYNQALPNGGVTFTGSTISRAIGAVDGLGAFTLCLTNPGLYNGSGGQVRAAVSVDGLVNNFWTTGLSTSPNGYIKTISSGTPSNSIPQNFAGTDPRVVEIVGTNLWVSSGKNGGATPGLYSFSGLPSGNPSATAAIQLATGTGSDPNDFAFSPDGLTVYIADSNLFTVSSGFGGIERWDYNGSAWAHTYTLGTGPGNWGARCLTANFSRFPGGGAASIGAIIYATTSEASTNRIITVTDNGATSAANTLATAGPRQVFRGLRFGPVSIPAAPAQTALDYINVKSYGATGNGVTDDTAAFKSAVAAAQAQGLSGVYVPLGKYVISGTITLTTNELFGRVEGGWPADGPTMPTLLLRQLTQPGVVLNAGGSIHGLELLYDKGTPVTTNAPAISLNGNGPVISSVQIVNAYDGVNTAPAAQPGRARFADMLILNPAHLGIQYTRCYDWAEFRDIEVKCTGTPCSEAGFSFGQGDGAYDGLTASNCAIGLEFYSDPSVSNSSFTAAFANCSAVGCNNSVVINEINKLKFTGGDFLATNSGVLIENGSSQVIIDGGKWQSISGQAFNITEAANVIIKAAIAGRPAPYWTPLLAADNTTTLTVSGCQFLAGSTGMQLGTNLARAIIYGNSLQDGGVSNYMASSAFVVSSNLVTASPDSFTPAALGVVSAAQGGQLTLTWPGWATGYLVYSATNLTPPIWWQSVTNSPISNNGEFYLTLPTTNGGQQYFELTPP